MPDSEEHRKIYIPEYIHPVRVEIRSIPIPFFNVFSRRGSIAASAQHVQTG